MRACWLGVLLCGACGGGGDASDAGPASHRAYNALNAHSGTVIAHPQVVTITYVGNLLTPSIESFSDYIVTSDWWTAVATEYGVGQAASVAKRHIPTPPPTGTIHDADVGAIIVGEINAGNVPAPTAGDQIIYMIYMGPNVFVQEYLDTYGYHSQANAMGFDFPYAVILDNYTHTLDELTTTGSHELVESATDPYVYPKDGFYMEIQPDNPFWFASGQEAADLCDYEPTFRVNNFMVQKSYSSKAAMAGGAPCVPSASIGWEAVTAEPWAMPHLKPGDSVTFTLTGWSTIDEADWTIKVVDADNSDYTAAQLHPVLSGQSINNGKTVTLTLTAPSNALHGTAGGVYVTSGSFDRFWPVGFQVP
jgi:hypothetical protein